MAKKSSRNARKTPRKTVFWEVVPEGHLKRLKAKREQHIADHIANQVTYPDPDQLFDLTPVTIKKLGFIDHDLQDLIGLEPLAARGRNRGKGKGGSSGGGRTLPNPQVVLSVVQSMLASAGLTARVVPASGDVVALELNCENCDLSKAKYFTAAWKALFECADIVYLEEVNCAAVSYFASITGYLSFCSQANSRGQAVGFLVNPNRFDVIGPMEEWTEVAQVQGIQDLRPVVAIKVKDKVTGRITRRAVGHLKSMRGGARTTESVRFQQFQKIAKRMGVPVTGCKPQLGQLRILQLFKNIQIGRGLTDHAANYWIEREPQGVQCVDGMWVFAGDCNDFLGQNTRVYDPMTQAGYLLLYPHDNTSTQSMGGRLDGAFRDVSSGTTCGTTATGPFADGTTDAPAVLQQ
jgi:hypothetical protein